MSKSLGEIELGKWMEEQEVSVNDLAQRCKVSSATVRAWISGESAPQQQRRRVINRLSGGRVFYAREVVAVSPSAP